jgi:hypothetical protein
MRRRILILTITKECLFRSAKEALIWSVSTGVTAIPFFKLLGSIAGINLLADSGGFIIILVVMVMIGFVAYFIAFLLLFIMERTESN